MKPKNPEPKIQILMILYWQKAVSFKINSHTQKKIAILIETKIVISQG